MLFLMSAFAILPNSKHGNTDVRKKFMSCSVRRTVFVLEKPGPLEHENHFIENEILRNLNKGIKGEDITVGTAANDLSENC